jgi:hypothetical protein
MMNKDFGSYFVARWMAFIPSRAMSSRYKDLMLFLLEDFLYNNSFKYDFQAKNRSFHAYVLLLKSSCGVVHFRYVYIIVWSKSFCVHLFQTHTNGLNNNLKHLQAV